MVSKMIEEMQEMKDVIADGKLPPDAIEKYFQEEERVVFGHDVKHDPKTGEPIERGLCSLSQPTRNSIEAYKAHQLGRKMGPEPGFESHLAAMEAALAAFEAKRKARNDAARGAWRDR
jgi:hypothetical protein